MVFVSQKKRSAGLIEKSSDLGPTTDQLTNDSVF